MRSMFHRVATSNEGAVTTATAIIIAAAATTTAAVGTGLLQAHQARKSQKSALAARASEIAGAEEKAALATSKAAKAAQTKLKKFRLSQTRSILTSPLGVQDEAVTGRTSLLGG